MSRVQTSSLTLNCNKSIPQLFCSVQLTLIVSLPTKFHRKVYNFHRNRIIVLAQRDFEKGFGTDSNSNINTAKFNHQFSRLGQIVGEITKKFVNKWKRGDKMIHWPHQRRQSLNLCLVGAANDYMCCNLQLGRLATFLKPLSQ